MAMVLGNRDGMKVMLVDGVDFSLLTYFPP